jgi:hypothetical protein
MVLLMVSFTAVLFAEDALEIIRKVDEMGKTTTSIAKMSMLVFPYFEDNSNYRDIKVLAYGRGDENSYMEFISPKSIKGLRILSLGGDQWVYFPSTGRVRKIAAKSKDESVQGIGGDFSYEDLGGGSLEEKYTFTILKSEADHWLLEGTPTNESSSYSKILLKILKESYQVPKIEFYTEADGHKKDLIQEEVKTISGRLTPTQMTMLNLVKLSKTVVIIHEAQYDVEIDEKYFNPMRFYK